MHVDFAHAEIGGGLLFRGCGEEEIRFCIAPELSVACLVCSKMMPNEAVVVTGYERFSNYTGKGFTMDYAGNFVDPSPRYEDGSLRTCLVCIDPSRFDKFQEKLMRLQLSRQVLQRELDKVRGTHAHAPNLTMPFLPLSLFLSLSLSLSLSLFLFLSFSLSLFLSDSLL
jgi:hypothetical protein